MAERNVTLPTTPTPTSPTSAPRISALHEQYVRGKFGALGEHSAAGVALREVGDLTLHQIAAWPDAFARVARQAADAAGVESAPCRCASVSAADSDAALLRVEPMKWWLLNAPPPPIAPEHGATLDLSHSRTRVRITGAHATALLNRHLPLDLRHAAFPEGAVASSALHHVGVTLWRSPQGYDLFIPRGFALSLWQLLVETAAQFGGEIV